MPVLPRICRKLGRWGGWMGDDYIDYWQLLFRPLDLINNLSCGLNATHKARRSAKVLIFDVNVVRVPVSTSDPFRTWLNKVTQIGQMFDELS